MTTPENPPESNITEAEMVEVGLVAVSAIEAALVHDDDRLSVLVDLTDSRVLAGVTAKLAALLVRSVPHPDAVVIARLRELAAHLGTDGEA